MSIFSVIGSVTHDVEHGVEGAAKGWVSNSSNVGRSNALAALGGMVLRPRHRIFRLVNTVVGGKP